MRLLVTRPRRESEALESLLEAQGHEVLVEPLLEIRFAQDIDVDLVGVQALVFTSANGVEAFARVSEARALPVFVVGKVTAGAAQAAGFENVVTSGGDVDLLAADVAEGLDPGHGSVLHAAGSHVAGDLKGLLEAEGFEVRREVLYEAVAATAFTDLARRALEADEIDAVLLYSWRSAICFAELLKREALPGAGLACLCLSKNVAKALDGLNFSKILVAGRPEQDLLLKLLKEASN